MNKFKSLLLKFFNKSPEKIIIKNLINKYLPKKGSDFNASQSSYKNYRKEFLNPYTNFIIPLALEQIKINDLDFPKVLDIGCGFAPMCLASKIYRDIWLKNKKTNNDYYYVGIDIRKDAI